ncbi:S-adenosyl-L-methionine-dependent methyltransferase [Aspergillus heteromorphus CBS 117.55]|uniref:S-adenosyl-L-methionine-dependent methyltransferase n=1 Tax=Aspergillus heteromorphus CBS 117.55 TaxID=1448321 RepID=A0A317V543_9EURO|nr:S-adenosyl-L-methionine-dependent methyltransferase [Aspergillus heteromorphus CBS 117.55]PWY69116.1 S-adenosyl-L-methionine-dependent methyltransferase [Aspergillus heteromorphus CBS 117.55]
MPASHVTAIQSIYDERSESYDNSHHGVLAEAYIRAAQPKPGKGVLDLACGAGLVSLLAEEKVGKSGQIVGIDISNGMLDVARRKAQQAGSKATFIQHDISDLTGLDILPLGSEGFDLITCAAALVLLPNPEQAIKHWATWLKPGGRLVTDVAAKDVHVPSRILRRISDTLGVSLQWDESWVQSEQSLADLLARAGLDVKKVFLTESFQERRYLVADAGEAFEKAVASPMFRNFGDPAIKDRANRLFVEKFVEEAGSEGVLLDEAKMYMGIAYKV